MERARAAGPAASVPCPPCPDDRPRLPSPGPGATTGSISAAPAAPSEHSADAPAGERLMKPRKTGYTGRPGDPRSLAVALRHALAATPADRARRRAEARQPAATRHDYDKTVRSFLHNVAPCATAPPMQTCSRTEPMHLWQGPRLIIGHAAAALAGPSSANPRLRTPDRSSSDISRRQVRLRYDPICADRRPRSHAPLTDSGAARSCR